ncbi:MAG: hypothetical protein H0X37_03760 [Herpetosiphonaceae bacterium]|nr:hypothetical protein [Herpetosiphonaceae bacterium]
MTQYTVPASGRAGRLLNNVGLSILDIGFWLVGMLITFGIAMTWRSFLIGPSQVTNKYVLTFLLLAVVVVWTVLSLLLDRRKLTASTSRSRLVGSVLVRFGTAMLLFGTAISPIGLYYHNIPTYSVPVGFAYFTLAFIGMFVTGFGGNMTAPPKQ